ncbi:hypothetical protein B296_00028580 [Ensete ventricosum]|uniref:Uncharacterized protein n=1 Tax=Ensete ventricosum TaxID=4639 RepID=A0A426ZMI2_ENSVE|nr:hypothetical protein B296_00028580 [Ensete ventricosum]
MHHGPSVCNTLCSRVKIKMVNGAARAPATPKKEWEGERMLLPVVKLGSLALRTLSKPIASRLKQQAGNYPKFREYIIGLAQGEYLIPTTLVSHLFNLFSLISCNSICFHLLAYGVSCPWQAMKQKEQELAKELELLRVKLHELEHLARGRGLLSIFCVTQGQESLKSVIPTLAS